MIKSPNVPILAGGFFLGSQGIPAALNIGPVSFGPPDHTRVLTQKTGEEMSNWDFLAREVERSKTRIAGLEKAYAECKGRVAGLDCTLTREEFMRRCRAEGLPWSECGRKWLSHMWLCSQASPCEEEFLPKIEVEKQILREWEGRFLNVRMQQGVLVALVSYALTRPGFLSGVLQGVGEIIPG